MPDTGRYVGHKIGFTPMVVVYNIATISRPPATVGQLARRQPAIGMHSGRVFSANGEAHRGFHMVPGVGVAAVEPGNFATGALAFEQVLDRGPQELLWKQATAEIEATHERASARK